MKNINTDLTATFTSPGPETDVRSPRTPVWAPSPTSFFTGPPFDPSRIFASSSPTIPAKPAEIPLPPKKPLVWVWQCHLCHSRYSLGATRRCLQDGHYYCSGEADRPNLKKKQKGKSCSSEFDYIGWRETAEWQRNVRRVRRLSDEHHPSGCENCEFPSQCRYSVSTPSSTTTRTTIDPAVLMDVDLSSPLAPTTTPMTASPQPISIVDKLSRFYKKDAATFESILASVANETSKIQSKMTDFYKPDKPAKGKKARTGSASLKDVVKSAERRSGKVAKLSPIEEDSDGSADVGEPELMDMDEYVMSNIEL